MQQSSGKFEVNRVRRKRVPTCLRALGRREMPPRFELDGVEYEHVRTYKHDFFAVTGLYESDGRRVILKIGRREGFMGVPMAWIGRRLAQHEADCLRELSGREGVPALVGVWQGNGLVHKYVPGGVLRKGCQVDDDFFGRLGTLLETMHQRGMAYVDLEKPQNVLVGDDGRPYLIDYQISWPWPVGRLTDTWIGRWLQRRLQEGDGYHLRKLQRRFRRDQLTEQELAISYRRPWPVRMHRKLTEPATRFRRWVLAKVDPNRHGGERGRYKQGRATS